MRVSKEERVEHSHSSKCIVSQYPFEIEKMNIAHLSLNGRHPVNGFAMNEEVSELLYVISGSGRVEIEEKEYKLNEGDAVLIKPNHKYYMEGDLKILITCSPAWTPEQHKSLESYTIES